MQLLARHRTRAAFFLVAASARSRRSPGPSWPSRSSAASWQLGDRRLRVRRRPGTDCGIWGDGSRLTMQIGFGKTPKVTIKDDRSTACLDGGAGPRWAGSGTGWYTQDVAPDGAPGPIYLHVVLAKVGCGSFATIGDPGRDMAPGDTEPRLLPRPRERHDLVRSRWHRRRPRLVSDELGS